MLAARHQQRPARDHRRAQWRLAEPVHHCHWPAFEIRNRYNPVLRFAVILGLSLQPWWLLGRAIPPRFACWCVCMQLRTLALVFYQAAVFPSSVRSAKLISSLVFFVFQSGDALDPSAGRQGSLLTFTVLNVDQFGNPTNATGNFNVRITRCLALAISYIGCSEQTSSLVCLLLRTDFDSSD